VPAGDPEPRRDARRADAAVQDRYLACMRPEAAGLSAAPWRVASTASVAGSWPASWPFARPCPGRLRRHHRGRGPRPVGRRRADPHPRLACSGVLSHSQSPGGAATVSVTTVPSSTTPSGDTAMIVPVGAEPWAGAHSMHTCRPSRRSCLTTGLAGCPARAALLTAPLCTIVIIPLSPPSATPCRRQKSQPTGPGRDSRRLMSVNRRRSVARYRRTRYRERTQASSRVRSGAAWRQRPQLADPRQ
jgi:hypothetical protein